MAKLIRDKFVDIKDKDKIYYEKHDKNKFAHLHHKILEELGELKDSVYLDETEWADVIESLLAMMKYQNINIKDVSTSLYKKRKEYGKFDDFLILK